MVMYIFYKIIDHLNNTQLTHEQIKNKITFHYFPELFGIYSAFLYSLITMSLYIGFYFTEINFILSIIFPIIFYFMFFFISKYIIKKIIINSVTYLGHP